MTTLLSESDVTAIVLTLKLATVVTALLLALSIPLAWWLANTTSKMRAPVNALVAMPLVLPPTVLGFYLLIAMGPQGPIGQLTTSLGLPTLAFSFSGLVLGSMLYSLPFVVQPIQNAFAAIGRRPLEVAATLGASSLDRFFSVAIPLAKPGIITGAVLGFAHTVGEFGLVLMIGGNIEGETRVVSVQLYDHVEALAYGDAHGLALVLLIFSFSVLLALFVSQSKSRNGLFSTSTPEPSNNGASS